MSQDLRNQYNFLKGELGFARDSNNRLDLDVQRIKTDNKKQRQELENLKKKCSEIVKFEVVLSWLRYLEEICGKSFEYCEDLKESEDLKNNQKCALISKKKWLYILNSGHPVLKPIVENLCDKQKLSKLADDIVKILSISSDLRDISTFNGLDDVSAYFCQLFEKKDLSDSVNLIMLTKQELNHLLDLNFQDKFIKQFSHKLLM